jgi:NTP pyrophosphatase (non-canonical NTP hydrolase)
MLMIKYQDSIDSFAVYPGKGTHSIGAVLYCTLGLCGEAGEFAEKVKKALRDDHGVITAHRREEIIAELGDVLWYLAQLHNELQLSLASTAQCNLDKLLDRKERGKLSGSGDNR